MASDKKLSNDYSYVRNEYASTFSIKGKEFLPLNVINCVIRESIFDFIPTVLLTILDNGIFSEQYPIEIGDILKVSLSRSNNLTHVINAEFIIHDFKIDNNDGDKINSCSITLTGYLKCKNLFQPLITKSFSNKTSTDVIDSIAKECGFDTDIRVKTSDNMNWLQVSQSNYSMIFDTMKRAFKRDDALVCGVTRDSKMILSSLDKIQSSKSSIPAVFDIQNTISSEIDGGSPIYYNSYNISNMAGTNSNRGGNKVQFGYHDFDSFVSDTIDFSRHPLTKLAYKNKNQAEDLVYNINPTVLNNKNMFKEYYRAMATNIHANLDFFKESIILQINPNFSVNIMDLVDLKMPSQLEEGKINNPISGKYVVTGSYFQASKAGLFRQGLILFRNGFNPSDAMKNDQYSSVK